MMNSFVIFCVCSRFTVVILQRENVYLMVFKQFISGDWFSLIFFLFFYALILGYFTNF